MNTHLKNTSKAIARPAGKTNRAIAIFSFEAKHRSHLPYYLG
ncbi:MAG: hypothetical protein V7K18_06835 [Nostoc sp.]